MKIPKPPGAWRMPAWMEPYRHHISRIGADTVEDLVNDVTTTVRTNPVRAGQISAVVAQVNLLHRLHMEGKL